MKKQIILSILMTAVLSLGATSIFAAGLIPVEEAIESDALKIRLSNDLTGIIKGKRCDDCEAVLVKITPATRFDVNGETKNLIEAQKWAGKPGTVIYNIETRNATAISVYQ